MSKYADIISRLKAATGPSDELSARVKCVLLAPDGAHVEQSKINGRWCIYEVGYNGARRLFEYRNIPSEIRLGDPTASLDAAIGLVERMLPGGEITLTDTHADFLSKGEHRHSADIMRGLVWSSREGFPQPDYEMQAIGSSSTRPIALLIALFRALEALEAQS